MDPNEPSVDESMFNLNADWMEFYGDVTEEDPPGMPEPLGKAVSQHSDGRRPTWDARAVR